MPAARHQSEVWPRLPANHAVAASVVETNGVALLPMTDPGTTNPLTAEPATGPWYLVPGQGYDRRWRATMDGQPLGPPELLDGYSIGWRVSDPGPHRFVVSFGPQRPATASLVATLAALAVVAALLLAGRRSR